MISKSLKCSCRQRPKKANTAWSHVSVASDCRVQSLAAMYVQCLWTPVFWVIMLLHWGWQVLTSWRIIIPSFPRLEQMKKSFAKSRTAYPTMQNLITEDCNRHLFRPFAFTDTSYTTSSAVKRQAYEGTVHNTLLQFESYFYNGFLQNPWHFRTYLIKS